MMPEPFGFSTSSVTITSKSQRRSHRSFMAPGLTARQCHDHPLAGEIKQEHYWGLVAAFNRSKNTERGTPAIQESASGGFINFTNLKKESQPAAIVMLTGSKIDEPRPRMMKISPIAMWIPARPCVFPSSLAGPRLPTPRRAKSALGPVVRQYHLGGFTWPRHR